MRIVFSLLIACLVFQSLAVRSSWSEVSQGKRGEQPIHIKSNELTADGNGKIATFIGDVVARQDDVTILCDRMVVRYGEQEQEISRIEAFGNVRIIQGNRQGHSGKAIYDNRSGTITLEENPRVMQGEDVVTGKVITFHLDDQKSLVTGDKDRRVEATIKPKGKGADVLRKP